MTLLGIVTFVLALIGAGAWTPFLIEKLKKPTLYFFTEKFCEIGHTHMGPIFNFNAFSRIDSKEVLINKIEIELTNLNSGAKSLFECHEVATPTSMFGPTGPFVNSENFMAALLTNKNVLKAQLRNRIASFSELLKIHLDNIESRKKELYQKNEFTHEKLFSSKEVQDLIKFYQSNSIWQTGKYSAEIKLKTITNPKLKMSKMTFELIQDDILKLNENINNLSDFINKLIENDFKETPFPYNWIYKKTEVI